MLTQVKRSPILLSRQATELGQAPMSYRTYGTRKTQSTGPRGLVTPRQMAALDRMASANGFPSGSALLCDVASCDLATLGRKSRPVVQMFVDQAFARYGRASQSASPRGVWCETPEHGEAPHVLADDCTHPHEVPPPASARYARRGRCEDAPCCGCCD